MMLPETYCQHMIQLLPKSMETPLSGFRLKWTNVQSILCRHRAVAIYRVCNRKSMLSTILIPLMEFVNLWMSPTGSLCVHGWHLVAVHLLALPHKLSIRHGHLPTKRFVDPSRKTGGAQVDPLGWKTSAFGKRLILTIHLPVLPLRQGPTMTLWSQTIFIFQSMDT